MDGLRPSLAALERQFGYPDSLLRAMNSTVEALEPLEPRSVILMGSAARGELTWRSGSDGLEMFSDIELACFLDRRDPAKESAARERIAEIERAVGVDNGLFHIDVLIARAFPSGRHSRGLLWYEAGRSHRLLAGEEQPYDFGPLRPERLSIGLVNELVLIRLWWMLIYFPAVLLDDAPAPLAGSARERAVYVQTRNLLDVASIWLPNEGVYEVGYRARSEAVHRHWHWLEGAAFLPTEFPEWLAEATRKKLACDLEGDPIPWYVRAVRSYRGLTRFLLGVPPGSDRYVPAEALDRWSAVQPAPRSWRFRVYRAWTTLRQAGAGPGGIGWIARRAHPAAAALAFLLGMHGAVVAHLDGREDDARRALATATDALHRLAPIPGGDLPTTGSFARRWHGLRQAFVDPFIAHHRKLRGHRDSVMSRLKMETESLDI